MMTSPFPSRHLGDYLLVAQLGDDALGTVFRALYAADDRRFVRLRILRSDELSPDAIVSAVRRNSARAASLSHEAIVVRPQLDVFEEVPIMTWDEAAGWTLDAMLARVRAFGIHIPAEYALLIAERIAAALEHVHQTHWEDRPADHGILWPGFVSISHDASVRVGGFGITEGVLPSLQAPRLTAEIAPYVAPEARQTGSVGDNSDVYSLGAILLEMMTGRRPSLERPAADLRAKDTRSRELGSFLRHCLDEPRARFASAVEAHRALQQMVTGSPYSLYTANLALFLYKLLNPESQSVAASSDWESTNPVVLEASKATGGEELSAGSSEAPRPSEEPASARAATNLWLAPPDEPPAQGPPIEAQEAAPAELREHAAELLDESEGWRPKHPAFAWTTGAAGLAAAAGVVVAVFLIASQLRSSRAAAPQARAIPAAAAPAKPAPAPPPAPKPEVVPDSSILSPVVLESAQPKTEARGRFERAVKRSDGRPTSNPPQWRGAEDLRLRAALARVEADSIGSPEEAGDLFGEGRKSEEQGQRLMRERDYAGAELAFLHATQLFQQAQAVRWDARVRRSDLSGGN